ncbi:unnamed protein product [Fraxinus pennsylvanica]|uniref:GDPGP1-like C-terminal domain-containing protein n=1 Tax=Fraxinus pennsylvanica TaxID=56036 RepID=A0AAD2E614_9LAMI|nr:unnamed protein product [Fraxinus pennsylvanica]
MKAGTSRRGQLSFELIRSCSPSMKISSTSLRLGQRKSSFNLNQAWIMKSSSFQMHLFISSILLALSPSIYVSVPLVLSYSKVSPVEYGHVLIPQTLERLPQRIDRDSFLLALYMAAGAKIPTSAWVKIAWVHLQPSTTFISSRQVYYLAVTLPIEMAPTRKITTSRGVKICDILNYPIRGLVFECGNTLDEFSNDVSDSSICLQDNNIPYNVLIADSGRRIFLIPQYYTEKQALGEVSFEFLNTQVDPAAWEITGHITHMVLKRKEDYEKASEENAWRLLAEVSLSEERLHEVKELLFEAISCSMEDNGVTQNILKDSDIGPQSLEDVDSFKGAHRAIVLRS